MKVLFLCNCGKLVQKVAFENLLKLFRFECNPPEAALTICKMYVMFSSLWPGDSFQPVLLS